MRLARVIPVTTIVAIRSTDCKQLPSTSLKSLLSQPEMGYLFEWPSVLVDMCSSNPSSVIALVLFNDKLPKRRIGLETISQSIRDVGIGCGCELMISIT
jgi:hypothetical protein